MPKNTKRKQDQHILSCEHAADYQEILQALTEHYAPSDNAESWLVEQLAHAHWRIGRAQTTETGTYSVLLERMRAHFETEKTMPDQRLLKIWNAAQARTQSTSNYEARLWRIANQIRADLDRMNSSRTPAEPPSRPVLVKRRRPAA